WTTQNATDHGAALVRTAPPCAAAATRPSVVVLQPPLLARHMEPSGPGGDHQDHSGIDSGVPHAAQPIRAGVNRYLTGFAVDLDRFRRPCCALCSPIDG